MLSSTESIPGYTVQHSSGPVFGEAILGSNLFSDFFASVRDIVGGRSNAYQEQFKRGRNLALVDLASEAAQNGANAVIGLRVDYEMVRDSMMMIAATGTAVVVKESTEG